MQVNRKPQVIKKEAVVPRAIGNRNNPIMLVSALIILVAIVIVVLWLAGVF